MQWRHEACTERVLTCATRALDVNWERVNTRSALVRQMHGPCFGTCPVYSISVWGDGRVEYYGANYVRACGVRTKRISQDAAIALVELARTSGFFWRGTDEPGDNCGWWTDAPTVSTRIDLPGYGRAVRHYVGASCFSTRLQEFEDAVPRIAGIADWLGDDKTAMWCEADNDAT